MLSPYLLLKLRDVEISEIKFTAALVASNKNLFLILQKQKKKRNVLACEKKEGVEHPNNGRSRDAVEPPPRTIGIMAPNMMRTISLYAAFRLLSAH